MSDFNPTANPGDMASTRTSFFSKEATLAAPGFNAPLSKATGITKSAPEDWALTTPGWIFSLAIFFLGLSAAFAGKWLERVGPRRTKFPAACCFGGGLLVSAL